jgi:hypothetical protein
MKPTTRRSILVAFAAAVLAALAAGTFAAAEDGQAQLDVDDGALPIASFAGLVPSIQGNSSKYVFAGPSASVSTDANDRLTGAATAPLGLSTGSQNADIGLCYQSTLAGSPLVNFVGGNFSVHSFNTTRRTYTASATTVPGAGNYNVGMCVRNNGPSPINNNNLLNGWVMVSG